MNAYDASSIAPRALSVDDSSQTDLKAVVAQVEPLSKIWRDLNSDGFDASAQIDITVADDTSRVELVRGSTRKPPVWKHPELLAHVVDLKPSHQ